MRSRIVKKEVLKQFSDINIVTNPSPKSSLYSSMSKEQIYQLALSELQERVQQEYQMNIQLMMDEMRKSLDSETKKLKAHFDAEFKRQIEEAEVDVLTLVFDIAKKICGYEISQNKEITLTAIKEGLKQIGSNEKFSIQVNPVDYEYVLSKFSELTEVRTGASEIEINQSSQVRQGGALIHGNKVFVDASVEGRFENMRSGVFKINDRNLGK